MGKRGGGNDLARRPLGAGRLGVALVGAEGRAVAAAAGRGAGVFAGPRSKRGACLTFSWLCYKKRQGCDQGGLHPIVRLAASLLGPRATSRNRRQSANREMETTGTRCGPDTRSGRPFNFINFENRGRTGGPVDTSMYTMRMSTHAYCTVVQ